MPAELFVDTSAWYAISADEGSRAAAAQAALKARVDDGARVVTTNLVLAESHALLMKRKGREAALAFVQRIAAAPGVVIEVNTDHEAAAIRDWLMRYRDQDFSLTDAVSFAVMKERGICEALTLDRHFRTAGFVVVPG
ncbi:MAG: PIN domain-containing protein [Gemmatimonadota bacterium]|nr:PIN domain-containing protein [Gemmatimonadota bacterium]